MSSPTISEDNPSSPDKTEQPVDDPSESTSENSDSTQSTSSNENSQNPPSQVVPSLRKALGIIKDVYADDADIAISEGQHSARYLQARDMFQKKKAKPTPAHPSNSSSAGSTTPKELKSKKSVADLAARFNKKPSTPKAATVRASRTSSSSRRKSVQYGTTSPNSSTSGHRKGNSSSGSPSWTRSGSSKTKNNQNGQGSSPLAASSTKNRSSSKVKSTPTETISMKSSNRSSLPNSPPVIGWKHISEIYKNPKFYSKLKENRQKFVGKKLVKSLSTSHLDSISSALESTGSSLFFNQPDVSKMKNVSLHHLAPVTPLQILEYQHSYLSDLDSAVLSRQNADILHLDALTVKPHKSHSSSKFHKHAEFSWDRSQLPNLGRICSHLLGEALDIPFEPISMEESFSQAPDRKSMMEFQNQVSKYTESLPITDSVQSEATGSVSKDRMALLGMMILVEKLCKELEESHTGIQPQDRNSSKQTGGLEEFSSIPIDEKLALTSLLSVIDEIGNKTSSTAPHRAFFKSAQTSSTPHLSTASQQYFLTLATEKSKMISQPKEPRTFSLPLGQQNQQNPALEEEIKSPTSSSSLSPTVQTSPHSSNSDSPNTNSKPPPKSPKSAKVKKKSLLGKLFGKSKPTQSTPSLPTKTSLESAPVQSYSSTPELPNLNLSGSMSTNSKETASNNNKPPTASNSTSSLPQNPPKSAPQPKTSNDDGDWMDRLLRMNAETMENQRVTVSAAVLVGTVPATPRIPVGAQQKFRFSSINLADEFDYNSPGSSAGSHHPSSIHLQPGSSNPTAFGGAPKPSSKPAPENSMFQGAPNPKNAPLFSGAPKPSHGKPPPPPPEDDDAESTDDEDDDADIVTDSDSDVEFADNNKNDTYSSNEEDDDDDVEIEVVSDSPQFTKKSSRSNSTDSSNLPSIFKRGDSGLALRHLPTINSSTTYNMSMQTPRHVKLGGEEDWEKGATSLALPSTIDATQMDVQPISLGKTDDDEDELSESSSHSHRNAHSVAALITQKNEDSLQSNRSTSSSVSAKSEASIESQPKKPINEKLQFEQIMFRMDRMAAGQMDEQRTYVNPSLLGGTALGQKPSPLKKSISPSRKSTGSGPPPLDKFTGLRTTNASAVPYPPLDEFG